MAFKITYNAGVYEVDGMLVLQSSSALKSHVEALMDYSNGIVLSLNKVLDIDSEAVKCIATLYRKAWLNDKMFYIIGMKNKRVSELFCSLNMNNILL